MKPHHNPRSPEILELYGRFSRAFDALMKSGQIPDKSAYCKKVGLNRVRVNEIKRLVNTGESAYKTLEAEALMYICRDFNVSPTWLLTGRGKMFTNANKTQRPDIC